MEKSGKAWCARFQTSNAIEDLAPPFRDRASGFVAALKAAGAGVSIAATYRPAERAYLMHWCCMIADSGQDPASVPHMAGVEIDWTHGGNVPAARAAAREMKAAYQIQYPAALVSRHTQRLAVDMSIGWKGTLTIKDGHGHPAAISSEPRNGSNAQLQAIGASYGVIKLASDPPHWSSDGH